MGEYFRLEFALKLWQDDELHVCSSMLYAVRDAWSHRGIGVSACCLCFIPIGVEFVASQVVKHNPGALASEVAKALGHAQGKFLCEPVCALRL